MSKQPILEIKNLSAGVEGKQILKGVSLIINPGEHFEEGMDADDLMFMWERVQRSGYLNVWRFQTDADIDRCDKLYPPAGGGGGAAPTEPASATQEDQVCVIMISVFAIELMAEAEANGQPMPELADDDIREAHAECLTSLEAARQSRTGQQYDTFPLLRGAL